MGSLNVQECDPSLDILISVAALRYRLDYYDDDIPKFLDEDTVERPLMNSYHIEDVEFQLEQLREGVRVHIRSGVLVRDQER